MLCGRVARLPAEKSSCSVVVKEKNRSGEIEKGRVSVKEELCVVRKKKRISRVWDPQPKVAGRLLRWWQSLTEPSLLCVFQFVADSTTICKSLEIPAVFCKDGQ